MSRTPRISVTPLHRVAIALVALPLWIVMVLTGGQWCLMAGNVSAHPVVTGTALVGHAAMAGRSHDAHAVGTRATSGKATPGLAIAERATEGASAQDASVQDATTPSREGAEHGPRSCESQAACSVAIAPAPLLAGAAPASPPAHPLGGPGDRLASRTPSPELPPPRA